MAKEDAGGEKTMKAQNGSLVVVDEGVAAVRIKGKA
jgi:hypothetical protein